MRVVATMVSAAMMLSCGGVAATQWVPLAPASEARASRSAEDVDLFTAHAPGRPYKELGVLDVQESCCEAMTASDLLETMRTEAGARGCDGLVVTGFDTIGSHYARMGYRGTCIVYTTSPGED